MNYSKFQHIIFRIFLDLKGPLVAGNGSVSLKTVCTVPCIQEHGLFIKYFFGLNI